MNNSNFIPVEFSNSKGEILKARIDLPYRTILGWALFAHCFTCTKESLAASRISSELAKEGVAVLRFDFTGLGGSGGDFTNTDFSSNIDDLVQAARFLKDNYAPPSVLIGHSFGGAAVLAAASRIPEAKAIVTIGSPSDVSHVLRHFSSSLEDIEGTGSSVVNLGGRPFKISQEFVENVLQHKLEDHIRTLSQALLVMHAPLDEIVSINHASHIFKAAKHPKSFISLDNANHLLTKSEDALYAARVIAAWATKYISEYVSNELPVAETEGEVIIRETGQGKFQNMITSGKHQLLADEPVAVGGLDSAPGPYDFLSIALGSCTSMTLRVYASFKALSLGRISVVVKHGKVAVEHCTDCEEVVQGRVGKIDRFERLISIEGDIDDALAEKIAKIADKCPVHQTLETQSVVITKVATSNGQQKDS